MKIRYYLKMLKQTKLDKDFEDYSIKVGMSMHFDQLSSKITSMLFLEPELISMDDIAERTGYSLASISNKMKILVSTGMVQKRKKPGSKKIYYFMHKNIHDLMKESMAKMFTTEIAAAKETIPLLIKEHEKRKLSKEEQAKLKIIKDYYKQMLKFEKMFKLFHKKMDEEKW